MNDITQLAHWVRIVSVVAYVLYAGGVVRLLLDSTC